jgi:hypothetical protein
LNVEEISLLTSSGVKETDWEESLCVIVVLSSLIFPAVSVDTVDVELSSKLEVREVRDLDGLAG